MSLIPKMDRDSCNYINSTLHKKKNGVGKRINCRNVWFREFWSQHNKCSFDPASNGDGSDGNQRKCIGTETISDYEQEGLVPFVGEFNYNP